MDLYEQQELLEAEEYDQEDCLPFPLYRNDDWLNEIDESWIEAWEDEH